MEGEGVEIAASTEGPGVREETRGALEDFGKYSRGRLTSVTAQRSFVRDLQISVLVATWTVILSLPVIIWPWAEYMNHTWCRQLDLAHCVKLDEPAPLCKIAWGWGIPHCAPARPSAFLNLWGTMLLQFIFSVYVDLGSSVKFTLQGLVGTILAYLNVMFLNNLLGFLLAGGAYAHSKQYDANGVVISAWLPLCNNGVQRLADKAAHCFLNIWIEKLTWLGSLSFLIVAVDFTLFVVLCLSLPFNSNPRIFALSTHVSFMMTFVDPGGDGFSIEPTYATEYLEMIGLASFMALLCFFVPKRRFTGTEAAETWGREAVEVTQVLVRRLPDTLEEVLRLKAKAILETAEMILKELERSVESARFERFAWLWRNEETHRRLELLPGSLKRCLQRLPAIYQSAEALGDGQIGVELYQCLQQCCEAAASKLDIFAANGGAEVSDSMAAAAQQQRTLEAEMALREAQGRLAQQWMQKDRPVEVSAFILVVSGVLAEVNEVVAEVQRHPTLVLSSDWSCRGCRRLLVRAKTWWSALLFHQDDTEAVHPRFVVRNTISICLAFSVGWLGIWNVMPSYSSYSASTIAVIVYTYTGATPSVTLRRLSGVVLGKVAGSILQLGLAVKHVVYIFFFSLAMWLVVAFTFFQYLHTSSDLAPVYGLTAAFAAASMIPSSGVLRGIADNTQASVLPTLMNTVVQTVFGISLMLLVDTALATRATKQARQRLGRAMDRLQLCLEACASSHMRPEDVEVVENFRSNFLQDLDALKDLLPHAAAEPIYWSKPFEFELFTHLEACLRGVANHMGMLCWLVNFAGSALLPLQTWDAVHQCWHKQVTSSWAEVGQICKSIVEPQSDADERLQEVLQELATTLYTFQVAQKVNLRVPRLPHKAAAGRKSGFRRLIDKVVHEDLDHDPRPSRGHGSAAPGAPHAAPGAPQPLEAAPPEEPDLEHCIQKCRAEAVQLEQQGPSLPQESALCAVDVASQLMRGSLEDIRKIQLALVEF